MNINCESPIVNRQSQIGPDSRIPRFESHFSRTLGTFAFLIVASTGIAAAQQPAGAPPPPPLKLTSTAFTEGAMIPQKYTCAAGPSAISPALQWTDVPKDTAGFVLIVHDMEPRPRKGADDVLHWLMWSIPASTKELPEGVPTNADLPDGSRQGNNIAGKIGYQPPCPPVGIPVLHHYAFELFAVDQKVDLPATAKRADVRMAMDGHIVGHAVLMGLFHR